MTTTAEEACAPEADGYTLFDLWTKTTTTTEGPISASVPPHGAVIFRVLPQN
jgi:alpha-galactosidase